jgi:hypothetical protein
MALRSAAAMAFAYGPEDTAANPLDLGWGWLTIALILLGMILALYANAVRRPPRHR